MHSLSGRRIQRTPTPAKPQAPGKDIVFIMGKDKNKKNPFYKEAVKFFKVAQPQATLVNDDDYRSLESVFDYLRANPERVANLYLVSHANEDGTLSFPLHTGDKERKTTFGALSTALKDSPELFNLPKGIIDAGTTIHIKGCNIGRSTRMLDALDQAFGGQGKVTAPTHKQVYGTKYSGKGAAQDRALRGTGRLLHRIQGQPADRAGRSTGRFPDKIHASERGTLGKTHTQERRDPAVGRHGFQP
ncbi:MAG: hypothetical protein IPK16_14795 [Anaerolineales bacterium]|nr:hypothetical protein [Anaerolineales bacterium]